MKDKLGVAFAVFFMLVLWPWVIYGWLWNVV